MAVAHNCRPTRMMSQTLRLFAALAWLCPADAVTFSTVGPDQGTTLYSGGSYAGLYAGAAAVGTTVYFAPDNTDKIGVLDTLTSGWSFIHTDLAGEEMYWGAVAVGTKVYFVPANQNNVGIFEVAAPATTPAP